VENFDSMHSYNPGPHHPHDIPNLWGRVSLEKGEVPLLGKEGRA